MTRDDVIRMAREAGAEFRAETILVNGKDADDFVQAFAALVAQKEREACAKVCDGLAYVHVDGFAKRRAENTDCANAIRARGAK